MRPRLSRPARRFRVFPAAFVLLCAPAWSEETDDLYGFYAEEATVVAAAKHAQPLSEAPASAYVVTRADIETYGYRTLAEVLQSVPGIFVTDDRNYSYVWVRGFGRPSDYNCRVLVLVNGHRMNENIFGSTFIGPDFSLDLRSVERVEVVKGPGSALYGDSAFFAIVNVITKSTGDAARSQAGGSAGSFGTRTVHSSYSSPLPHGAEILLTGSYRSMAGQNLFYPEFAAVDQGIARDADREESFTAYGSLERGGWLLHGNASSRTKRIPTGAYGTRFNDNGSKTVDARSFVELRTDRALGRGVGLHARAYRDWYRYRGDYAFDGTDSLATRVVNKDESEADWYGQELRLERNLFGTGNVLMVGQEFERNLRGWQTNYDQDPYTLFLDNDQRPYRWALFAQQELRPHPRLGLTLGLRYDRYRSFGSTVNPRLAAVLRLPNESRLKLLYGSAFRAPTPYEMFYFSPGYLTSFDLEPEKVRSLEAFWEKHVPRLGSVSASLFENRIRNLIDQTLTDAGEIAYANQERVVSRGLELSSKWDWAGRLSGHLGYLYQNSTTGRDRNLSNSPHHSGSIGLARRLPWSGATLGLETFFVGQRATMQGSTLPRGAVSSLHLDLRPLGRGLRLHAAVHNLTDSDYRVSGAGEHVQDSIRQDGRSFAFEVEYRFRDGASQRK